ncbi:MAG: N-acetylmuramoyl-L-alanine amidase [Porphyromonas sp.]|nr:N-acetylmuramoyl-L-alanine amidase [Porphyromonas sp.]
MRRDIRILLLLITILATSAWSGVDLSARDDKGRFIVVLDAGHGGKDSGAKGRRSLEKNITLDVVRKVGRRINQMDANIVVYYTRDKDVFVDLWDRTDFANRKKADLFVSIHANAHKTSTPKGAETFVLGLHRSQDNLEVAMKENAAILYEEDRGMKYEGFDPSSDESYIIFEFIQNRHLDASISLADRVQQGLVSCGLGNRGVKQAGFLVLHKAAMPSILVELGFISNSSDEAFMLSSKGSQQLADNIADAIVDYATSVSARSGRGGGQATQSTPPAPQTPQVAQGSTSDPAQVTYKIQVHADNRLLTSDAPVFRGYEPYVSYYKEGDLYKYTLYSTTDLKEAKRLQKELRKKRSYKDCFIVGFNPMGQKVGLYY